MATQIFINLPVTDLPRSMTFFKALGFHFNEQFTDDTAACLVIDQGIHAMLVTEKRFMDFIPGKRISNAHEQAEVLLALSRDSREAVDQMVDAALAHGGSACRPSQDHGFMYEHSFQDPDGHIWELVYMPQG
ncbi:hypothetical protein A167_02470 [Alcanivorax sp. S71-1-4]|uniref:VOC family protein n=1 Tax=Alcanivorax sp. S71-1-4 TaxID=1177159 RepID=UPI00135AB12A|nr:VOC family protein [Alcanivorax sp. S71-1-4]KAF0808752.1 hypothetical protein A167_02470 [Alcanivorax sp. S71-1-4]